MQQHRLQTPDHSHSGVRVSPSRRQLDNRFPSLCFFVETGDHPFFELLLTSDRGLFDPARAGQRQTSNFYSSREDVGLLQAEDSRGAFHVPPVVIRGFAQQQPHPQQLYYVAIAYATEQGNDPQFSHPPQQLPTEAPAIQLADNFTATSLAHILGTRAEHLKTVGARPPGPGGLPLQPATTPTPAARPDTAPAEPDAAAERQGGYHDPGRDTSEPDPPPAAPPDSEPYSGKDTQAVNSNSNDTDLDYDDGFGELDEHVEQPPSNRQTEHRVINGYGDEDFDQISPEADEADDEISHSPSNQAPPPGPSPLTPTPLPPLDSLDGISAQSLEQADNAPASDESTPPQPQTPPQQQPLDDEGKRRLIEKLAALDSGEPRYTAINPDGEFRGRFGRDHPYYQRAHLGLSYGIGPFNQDNGTLGQLLTLMQQRDPDYFETVFGPAWQELLKVTNASGPGSLESETGRSLRVQPVAGSDLWDNEWLERFRLAGTHPPFQAAQNQLAAELFLAPALTLARQLGLASERGVALLYDRIADMGVSEARRYLLEQLSPVKTEAQRGAALAALLEGKENASLADFQHSVGLPASGQWDSQTHAHLLASLRQHQQQGREIPLTLPGYQEMLDSLVRAAHARPWEERLTRLRADPGLSDSHYL